MSRRSIMYAICLSLGAVSVFFAVGLTESEIRLRKLLSQRQLQLAQLERRNQELEDLLQKQTAETSLLKEKVPNATSAPKDPTLNSSASTSSAANNSSPDDDFRQRARLSAIEKFVPLDENQKDRLREKFKSQSPESTESLEDILGKENAEYYRTEMGKAFQRAQEEEEEKEVLLLARRLNLSEEQESRVRTAMKKAEEEVEILMKNRPLGTHDMESRVQAMVLENKLRQEALNKQLATVFSEEQYRRYLETQAASEASDFQVWHETSP